MLSNAHVLLIHCGHKVQERIYCPNHFQQIVLLYASSKGIATLFFPAERHREFSPFSSLPRPIMVAFFIILDS